MKRLNVILLIFTFILSSVGGIFLFVASASMQKDFVLTKAPVTEEITYTIKTYEDYFVDNFNLPSEVYTRDETTQVVTIDYTKIARKTVNDDIQLTYNGNAFFTITSDDLSGTGSQHDPYVFYNEKGFLYYMNNSLSRLAISYKYIQLGDDIYLNDEIFDEDGKPSGGDGIIYNYKCTRGWGLFSYFNGNNFSFSGLYFVEKDENKTDFEGSLFDQSRMAEVKNVNFKNFYINGNNCNSVTAICSYIEYAENITIHAGKIESKGSIVSGICMNIVKRADKCNNYANIYISKESAAGLFYELNINAVMENCNNYGNVTAFDPNYGVGSRLGGLLRSSSRGTIIKNCNNYGDIFSLRAQNGGFVAFGGGCTFVNCNNYGDINTVSTSGGFVGYFVENSDMTFENCANYGEVGNESNNYLGSFVGCASYEKENNGKIVIKNCYAKTNSAVALVGCANYIQTLTISDCRIDSNSCFYDNAYLIWANKSSSTKLIVENVEINVKNTNGKNFYLSYSSNKTGQPTILRNIIVNIKEGALKAIERDKNYDVYKIESLIINQQGEKQYYGSNFSGYYFAWKTGKLGIVAIDGKGQFQGTIDEEWLAKKGYTKKEI